MAAGRNDVIPHRQPVNRRLHRKFKDLLVQLVLGLTGLVLGLTGLVLGLTGLVLGSQTFLSVNQCMQMKRQKSSSIIKIPQSPLITTRILYSTVHFLQSTEAAMFDVQRQQVLDECQWAPGEKQLRYIETRTFANTGKLTQQNLGNALFLLVR
jgi:hypothetical protein